METHESDNEGSYTPPHNSSREETLSQILSTLKELTDWKNLQSKVNKNFII